ncbi:SMP-30/gluconolactonase/LRE family protein [Nocardia suismassiliense]|uniref:SMP-30/gluconolactonase/LRE family protein n=1 Tax=Nocardia suismassiliense TaxID=2077092 RepID=UPI000D1E0170|nr:SMP-30/gluconolactonase/LRE family protein [Nocardia suismassiliense]
MGMVGRRIRALCVTVAIAAGAGAAAGPAQGVGAAGCGGWQVDTLVQGLEQLENLEPDGRGGFYMSADSKIYHLDSAGQVRTVLANLRVPRGLQLVGSNLYFLAGGQLWQLDTGTERLTSVAPLDGNGLLRLPGGDLLTTWVGTEGGPSKGLTRYRPDTGATVLNWSPVPRSEGLALDPEHRAVYTDDLFTGRVIRVPLDAPDRWTVIATIPGLFPGLDDLTTSRSGTLYVAAHTAGEIHRVDPATGATCVIAAGLAIGQAGPSSVRIAPDGNTWALYTTLFDGTLRRLRPPPDTDLTPIQLP